jgi:hypothetical protein
MKASPSFDARNGFYVPPNKNTHYDHLLGVKEQRPKTGGHNSSANQSNLNISTMSKKDMLKIASKNYE